jgi:hypothetical protein
LWTGEILDGLAADPHPIDGRREQLKDARTWTTANRHEMLHQKGILDVGVLRNLFTARKSRNELVHRGAHPSEVAAHAAYAATITLLRIALQGQELPLFNMNLDDHSLSDPCKPVDRKPLEPEYWMAIPKLPGEEEME